MIVFIKLTIFSCSPWCPCTRTRNPPIPRIEFMICVVFHFHLMSITQSSTLDSVPGPSVNPITELTEKKKKKKKEHAVIRESPSAIKTKKKNIQAVDGYAVGYFTAQCCFAIFLYRQNKKKTTINAINPGN